MKAELAVQENRVVVNDGDAAALREKLDEEADQQASSVGGHLHHGPQRGWPGPFQCYLSLDLDEFLTGHDIIWIALGMVQLPKVVECLVHLVVEDGPSRRLG